MSHPHLSRTLALLGLVTMLGGCVADPAYQEPYGRVYSAPPPPPPVVYEESRPVVVYSQPPPPPVEVVTVAPAPGYFWVGGGWYWEGRRHVWHPGYWCPPRPGYAWVPHRWEQQGHGWYSRPGYWHRH